ncbi:MAG: hypothetical protein JSU05_00445 [Bacteroidetes bacterium]|nr:hypothetical protein [Bacteroidota bacterium]
MRKLSSLPDLYFLNRLALDEGTDPFSIDLCKVLEGIFQFASLNDMRDLFQQFCKAAMSEKYKWKEGPPGNLHYFAELLEQLIEAAYLIVKDKKKKLRVATPVLHKDMLPVHLSAAEYDDPVLVFERFFNYKKLGEWKSALHDWLHAALSNHSISDSVQPTEVLPFVFRMEKLIEVGWMVLH